MKKLYIISCLLISVGLIRTFAQGQNEYRTAVNEEWVTTYSQPDAVDNLQTAFDKSGNILIVGNTKTSNGTTDIQVTKLSPSGTILWQRQYNAPLSGNDYGNTVIADETENVIVGGRSNNGSSNGDDFITVKYDKNGTMLWERFYNGTGSQTDEITAISADNQDNIFVTGKSKGAGTQEDYATVKYDKNGTQKWAARYDYAALEDSPTAIVADNSGGVFVTGMSKSTATHSEYTTISYNQNGNQSSVNRNSLSTIGIEKSVSIKRESGGNIFVTGEAHSSTGTDKNIKTIKYNSQLNPQWVREYDANNLEQVGKALGLDGNGDVYITGHSINQSGKKEMVTIKYKNNGDEEWVRNQTSPILNGNISGEKIAVTNSGEVYVTGKLEHDNTTDILVAKYDEQATKVWERIYKAVPNESNIPLDIKELNNEVYVTGKKKSATQEEYITIKYTEHKHKIDRAFGNSGKPTYVKGELIVRFDRNSMLWNDYNRTAKYQFGTLEQFVNGSVIAQMEAKTGKTLGNLSVVKVFTNLTPDGISISRLGETIQVPDFWATLLLELSNNMDEQNIADDLNLCKPNVWYSEKNFTGEVLNSTNDTYYEVEQSSLHPTASFTNAHINVEGAWDYTRGASFVKVGVFDSGIDQLHPDLSGVVKGGYNFVTNSALSAPYDVYNLTGITPGHGTECGGIIGAKSNNNEGIAGIAGGDYSISKEGCSLYDMKITEDGYIELSKAVNAIQDGANSSSANRVDIMSNSWKVNNWSNVIHEQVLFANENKVLFIAAKGNDGNDNPLFPASYEENLVIAVTASGNNGEFKNQNNGWFNLTSSYGFGVDIMAPGAAQIVYTTGLNNLYNGFGGTSAACPHIAGVAGLIMSNYNDNTGAPNYDNLAPEDIEEILQRSATDKTRGVLGTENLVGPDQFSGYGLVNADEALKISYYPKYKFQHFDNTHNSSVQTTTELLGADESIHFDNEHNGLSAGTYYADWYRRTDVYTFNLAGSNDQMIAGWPRHSSTVGREGPNSGRVNHNNYGQIINLTSTSATLITDYYYLKTGGQNGSTINDWYPADPSSIKTAFTIYTVDPTVIDVNSIKQVSGTNLLIGVYPNPSNGYCSFQVQSDKIQSAEITLLNLEGKMVRSIFTGKLKEGLTTFNVDVSDLSDGMYLVRYKNEETVLTTKLIKSKN